MKTIKLNQLEQNGLNSQEESLLIGGAGNCGCGCYYANHGGSGIEGNYSANNAGGLKSTCEIMQKEDGESTGNNMMCLK